MGKIEGICAEKLWNDLLTEINSYSAHTVILSSEAFANLSRQSIERISKILIGYQIQVLAYEREYLPYALSKYTQNVKMGRFSDLFKSYIQNNADRLFLLPHIIGIWKDVFNKGKFDVKSLDNLKGEMS